MKRLTRRTAIKNALIAAPAIALANCPEQLHAAPTGTRPMTLQVAVTSLSTTKMRVSGRYAQLNGTGVAGMRVDVYSVGVAYFTRWHTLYTGSNGTFSEDINKPPVGTWIQIEVEGNGAYNRPLPTFSRP